MTASLTPSFLFGRAYGVVIGQIGQGTGKFYGNFPLANSLLGGGPFQPSPLRIAFDIEKTAKSTSNKAKIQIYNLSTQSRAQFPKGGYSILLYAGYNSLHDLIYFGDVAYVASERKGPDIISLFECGEAERVLTYGTFQQTYPPGIRVNKIISDVISMLSAQGVTPSSQLANALKNNGGTLIPTKIYNKGVVFDSSVRTVLDTILPPLNLKWFIQNNVVQVLSITGNNGELAAFISKNTGMIGVPSQGANGMVKFRSLLNSSLMPGTYAQLQSETVNGTFTIQKATFQGDSHDQKWEVECEAFQTQGALQDRKSVV